MPEPKPGPDKFGLEHSQHFDGKTKAKNVQFSVNSFQETRVRDSDLGERK